jgi:2-oxoglutarate ferredoxin oxidoreductase subunit delta
MKFKVRIDRERCKGCMWCVDACPRGLIRMTRSLNVKGHHHAEIANEDECVGCCRCTDVCPEAAIQIDRAETAREERDVKATAGRGKAPEAPRREAGRASPALHSR